ncbi:MAG: Transcriptional regulator [Nocardioides sp.]|jgi:transcriptional regulator GlxA family with amidase domain|uniref:GlxA family transcriptional regulator n=1 Tax=Nocardioides sp. TaxID=35761 RepID=UPI00261D3D71|nr:helix-turn-helix domain-containing protein [Nocardioides sp.]MCW2833500.1 Transcriptional regulator [Nocardioides sp.]
MPHPAIRVGVLLYDDCLASEALGLVDVLAIANRVALHTGQPEPFRTSIHAARPGPVRAANGVEIRARRVDFALDLLVVPGFDLDPGQDLDLRLRRRSAEVKLLQRVAVRGIPVATVCVGAFLLGAAGLLDGRRATTSWLFADELTVRHPSSTIDPRAMLVEDGPVTTTGAFSASVDLALHLVRLHAGESIVRATSNITLTKQGRSSQSPYVDDTLHQRVSRDFSTEVRRHLVQHIGERYDLPALAASHHISTRTLLRRFRDETGQTPLDFLQSARVARARQLLEGTDLSVTEIARSVGYADTSTFRRLFTGAVSMTPSHYRRTFGR